MKTQRKVFSDTKRATCFVASKMDRGAQTGILRFLVWLTETRSSRCLEINPEIFA